jgi:hypothetical protein
LRPSAPLPPGSMIDSGGRTISGAISTGKVGPLIIGILTGGSSLRSIIRLTTILPIEGINQT